MSLRRPTDEGRGGAPLPAPDRYHGRVRAARGRGRPWARRGARPCRSGCSTRPFSNSYWVVPADFEGRFADYNLFENGFSETLAAVAYTGKIDTSSIPERGLTPELTTNGTLRKAWRVAADGRRLLYKGSSDGCRPGEWLSEVLASQVAEAMGIDHAPYWHDAWEAQDCSVCSCFCTPQVSYVPFALAAGAASMPACIRFASRLSRESLEATCDMLAFDALVCNTDRHFVNFGYLVDARTNRVMRPAPVFDNGRALFPNYGDDEVAGAAMLAQYCRPAFGPSSFEELLARVIGPRQSGALERAADTLELAAPDGRFAARCQTLTEFLRRRAAELARLAPVDHDRLAAM